MRGGLSEYIFPQTMQVGYPAMQISQQAQDTAKAKALRQGCAYSISGPRRKPAGLEAK